MPELTASAHLQERVHANPKFTIHTNTEVLEFRRGRRGKFGVVVAPDRGTGEETSFSPAGAFVFVGPIPTRRSSEAPWSWTGGLRRQRRRVPNLRPWGVRSRRRPSREHETARRGDG